MSIQKGSNVIISNSGKIYTTYWQLANQFIIENPNIKWMQNKQIPQFSKSTVIGIKKHINHGNSIAAISFNDGFDDVFILIGIEGLIEDNQARRATYREVSEWLAQAKGLVLIGNYVVPELSYLLEFDKKPIEDNVFIRNIGSEEWLEPTINNLK